MTGLITHKERAALALMTVVLLSGCAGGELSPELLPSVETVAVPQEVAERTDGPVRVESQGEVPFYARFDVPVHDDDWTVIIFYRPPHCIPEDFNLLRFFHFPGENDPGAFACRPPTTSGIEIWENGPQVDFAPLQSELDGRGSVPVWFAAWPEVQAAMNDGFVTIGELEALPSRLVGIATTYSEFLRPSETNAEPMIEFTAQGMLDNGRAFEVDVHQELVDRENNHVWIEIADSAVDGWAVLAEKDNYEALYMPDILVDYIDITRMRQALENSGWNSDHIHDLREFNRETLQAELDWLEESVDENDIVLLYVTAHGDYLSDVVMWHDFFADEWEQIPSLRRLLVIDACEAADFTNAVASDPSPHLSVAAVAENEFSWKGVEEEGLPIVGGVFTQYFADAFDHPDADANGDGMVSVQEAALMAEGQQRTYLHNVVLAVPEFMMMFHARGLAPEEDPTYPRVIVDDAIGEPLYLALDAYR